MPAAKPSFSPDVLKIDPAAAAAEIEDGIRRIVRGFKRRGAVLGVSGGVDSSVVVALCARALGKDKVLALLMPEKESSPESVGLGQLAADAAGVRARMEDITAILEAAGCYRKRDAAIRASIPQFDSGFKSKIVLEGPSNAGAFSFFSVVVESPAGAQFRARLPLESYLAVVAASNFKQRARKMMEYHYADLLNYAVAGTPNLLEYDQGFFVKNGDGAADFKPIAHLYKSQVYQLAEYLGVPEEIRRRPPTTDTYSMPQTQEEFYFTFSYDKMDLLLYGRDHQVPAADVAAVLGISPEQAERAYESIDAKRRFGAYLHAAPALIQRA